MTQNPLATQAAAHRSESARFPGLPIVVLAPAACALLLCACKRQPAPMTMPPPEVSTVTVARKPVSLSIELPGRTSPYLIAEIRPQVSGLIQKRLFTEGSDVKAGQTLYEIDPAPFKAAYESAAASAEASKRAADRARAAVNASVAGVARQQAVSAFARKTRDRFEALLQEKAVSVSDRDQAVSEAEVAEATLKAAEAQVQSDREAVSAAEAAILQAAAALEAARINLGYTKITAPISGRIGKSAVTDGAIVTAYQPVPLSAIQQLDPIYVDVPQSTAELLRLRRRLEEGKINSGGDGASRVQLRLEDGSLYPQTGRLQFQDVTVDPTTGSVILRMVFPNPAGTLLPGMFARAVIEEGVNPQAILIPQQAVSRDPKGNPLAFVLEASGAVGVRMLSVDQALGDQWLVSAGLEPGDKVITEGSQKVRPGMPASEAQPHAAAAPGGAQPAPASHAK